MTLTQDHDLSIVVSASGEVDAGVSAGASALLLDEATGTRTRLASGGTMVNIRFMDVMAIAAALRYHQTMFAKEGHVYRCLILTENAELVSEAEAGNHDSYEWSMLNWFKAHGYALTWQWQSCMAEDSRDNAQEAKAVRTAVREATEWNL